MEKLKEGKLKCNLSLVAICGQPLLNKSYNYKSIRLNRTFKLSPSFN